MKISVKNKNDLWTISAILLLGPSKSGRSLWVKKWISFFTTGVTAEEQQEEQEEEEESFVLIV